MKRKLFLFWVAVCLLALPLSSFGQAVSGTLLGTVSDSTGATVANAKVTATNVATSTVYESVTNEGGNFTIPNLPPGTIHGGGGGSGLQEGDAPEHRCADQLFDARGLRCGAGQRIGRGDGDDGPSAAADGSCGHLDEAGDARSFRIYR